MVPLAVKRIGRIGASLRTEHRGGDCLQVPEKKVRFGGKAGALAVGVGRGDR